MAGNFVIEEITAIESDREILSDLLIRVVADGASIGFLPPLSSNEAMTYWDQVLEPGVILYTARESGKVIAAVQLQLCGKPNGAHRAEVAKLMTHPDYRRNGAARALLRTVEQRAQEGGRSLLVLDTREGDPSNLLYQSEGYIQAGRIPDYAISENGQLDATIIYYKKI
ncbi:GNAT family N-acetyltransferase [Paenibacillus sp. JX-17]|uniref:GNAT family N-acetyltransferase n=1 Tax=Paenibacillus lacisoli TaxID=3064525 RepID=A0ABT9CFI1_9BACL|nr:GNAT family N-acetyltransferase [Paenibacillus sp. JX-17]MDO7908030.1 GNAT family N-acetyltransferase [Paenibacillus sp. JX-17]